MVQQAPDKPDLDWEDKEPQAYEVRQVAQQTEASIAFREIINFP